MYLQGPYLWRKEWMLIWGKAREGETSGLVILDNDASRRARDH